MAVIIYGVLALDCVSGSETGQFLGRERYPCGVLGNLSGGTEFSSGARRGRPPVDNFSFGGCMPGDLGHSP